MFEARRRGPSPVGWLLLLAALASPACADKVRKADRAVTAAAASGQPADLAEAVARADEAAARRADDPEAQAVRARAHAAVVRAETGEAQILAIEAVAEALERAVQAGAEGGVHAALSAMVPEVEGIAMTALLNDVEARAYDDAARRLAASLRLRASGAALRGPDPELEAGLQRLAVQVTASTGRPAEARDHFAAFVAATGRPDPVLAGRVARSLAESGDPPGAIAFVSPLSAELPDDETLMRTEVDIRAASGDKAGAVARIDASREHLMQSVSGAFLAASLYEAVGEAARARAGWYRVLQLDPQHVDARIALGRGLLAEAVAGRAELAERVEELDAARPPKELLELVRSVQQAWTEAEESFVAACALDPRSRVAAQALVGLYEARVAGVDPETATRAERDALAVDEQKLRAARDALAALEPT